MKLLQNKKGQSATGALSTPMRTAEGEGLIPTPIRKFFQFLTKIILGTGKYAIGVVLIASFIWGIFYMYGIQQTGLTGTAIDHGAVAAKEQVPKVIEAIGLQNAYQTFFNPEALVIGYGFESDIEENENNEKLGVRITDLRPTNKFFEGDSIALDGTIKAQSIREPLTIQVYCELEDFNNEQKIPAQIASAEAQGNQITLYPGTEETILASCLFENAAEFRENEDDKVITSRQATMSVTYDFQTLAMHKTYFLNQKESNALKKRGQDPFDTYQIQDPQLNYDNTIRSRATAGPLKVAIGTVQSQPFTQNQPAAFAVTIANNPQYGGNVKTLQQITLHTPPNTILESDPEYGSQALIDQCAFETTGEVDQEGFKVYSVKDSELDQVNQDCKDITLATAHLTTEQCIKFYKGEMNFRCKFKATEVPEEGLFYDIIRADAEYIYETKKSKVITILRLPESGVTQRGAAFA